ncbi:MAG: hypothetical protein ACRDOA_09215 [Streptosporangiaceae bacterium]
MPATVPEPDPVPGPEPDPVLVPAAAETTEVTEPDPVFVPDAADVTPVAAEVTVPATDVTAEAAVTGDAAEVLVPDPAPGPEPDPVLVPTTAETTEVTEPEPELVPDAADVTPVAAEVTVPATDVTAEAAELTGDAAEVLVPDPMLLTADVTEPDPVLVPVAAAAEPVLVPVTGEVTGPMAEVIGPAGAGGTVAAYAWRENASRATRIPAATIVICTARRAMSRTTGCGMSSSRTTGDRPDPTRFVVPAISGLKHARANSHWVTRNRIFAIRREMYCSVITVQHSSRVRQRPQRPATALTANSEFPAGTRPGGLVPACGQCAPAGSPGVMSGS